MFFKIWTTYSFLHLLVLMVHVISRKVSYMKITNILPNNNILKYLIPPLHAFINMFVEYKLNHISLEFENPFKENYVSIIMIGKN